MGVGTLHQESNGCGYGFKTTAHALFINLAYKMLSTFCQANLSQPTHPEILKRNYVNSIVVDSLPSAVILQELLLASECDPTLKSAKEAPDTRNWSAAPKPFADLKDELCQKRGINLRNNRIVIPDAYSHSAVGTPGPSRHH